MGHKVKAARKVRGGHRELEMVEKEQEQIITEGGDGGKEEQEETRQGRGRTKENKRGGR